MMKKIVFIFVVLLWGCTKMEIEPTPPPVQKIFSVSESLVTDGQSIYFDLPSNGIYTLTLIDKVNDQVISRERFNGKTGENIKKIYTSSIQPQYLYLVLEDGSKTQIAKTTIKIN
jgi:hypothetical protein